MGDKKKEINYSEDAPIEEQLVSILKSLKKTITTAESITGGLISAAITSVEGASDCFKVGYVTYSNKSKRKLLSVKKELLRKEGAVSSTTAKEMAIGAMMESEADIAVAITGNAGPTALEGKEVGLIYIAVWKSSTLAEIEKKYGNRLAVLLLLWLETIFWTKNNAFIKKNALWCQGKRIYSISDAES